MGRRGGIDGCSWGEDDGWRYSNYKFMLGVREKLMVEDWERLLVGDGKRLTVGSRKRAVDGWRLR